MNSIIDGVRKSMYELNVALYGPPKKATIGDLVVIGIGKVVCDITFAFTVILIALCRGFKRGQERGENYMNGLHWRE